MSWEKNTLFNKSKIYFEKGFKQEKEDPFFGLFCAIGLELLAKAALANISPTLLAEPDREHKYLLHALNLGSPKIPKRTINTSQVINLCTKLIPEFTDELSKIAHSMVSRRNEELHTGSAAFAEYKAQNWIDGLYKCCKILAEHIDETLETLFGSEEAEAALIILNETEEKVVTEVESLIAAHKKVFDSKDKETKSKLINESKEKGEKLSKRGYHKIDCPSCGCTATLQGKVYGEGTVQNLASEIVVRQHVMPNEFNCISCELKLKGYAKLKAAKIANHYTRRTTYTPEEYYGLINPYDESAFEQLYEIQGINIPEGDFWDNE